MIERGSRVHFVGVGGIGMSGLASVLVSQGVQVTGSDLSSNRETAALMMRGARIHQGHAATHVSPDLDGVIVSSAIAPDHEEILAAKRCRIPVVPRLAAVAQLLKKHRSIGVAGTHGKTTTTAMIASLLKKQGLRPSYLIGADCPDLGGNACLDSGEWFVAEIDESDGLLVEVHPDISVLTNIGKDHLNTYRDVEEIEQAFSQYLGQSKAQILCVDDERVRRLAKAFPKATTVGIDAVADLQAAGLSFDQWRTSFDLLDKGLNVGRVVLPAPGRHNVRNALCAIAAAQMAGIPLEQAMRGLSTFRLPHRRFELLEENGVTVVDDYAHLPEEIEASLQAIRSGWPGRRIIAIFQPHRYTRTQALGSEFGAAFASADTVFVNPIYSACEARIPGTTSMQIVDAIRRQTTTSVQMIETQDQTVCILEDSIKQGDFIISFGAGDVWKVTERLARILEAGNFLH
ncbi:UDP-N-acetylmuramate--L-alanine ligase [Candidatus Bipolaricaulota bacterium]|nr:UDP-N-acetylmuramate--L-alanine ligase [Candidatus Bipolaricaulota bacterium]TFH10449.1 MAG: UDP-N-acetylmuramate--L-alanine ligase [Candidatus Atribacteria bacterium]